MLVLLGLWLALAPLTLITVAVVVYLPRTVRDERGAVLQPWRRRPRGRHRRGLSGQAAPERGGGTREVATCRTWHRS
jgi:hypothetical protein